jgi:hypothetical protein
MVLLDLTFSFLLLVAGLPSGHGYNSFPGIPHFIILLPRAAPGGSSEPGLYFEAAFLSRLIVCCRICIRRNIVGHVLGARHTSGSGRSFELIRVGFFVK